MGKEKQPKIFNLKYMKGLSDSQIEALKMFSNKHGRNNRSVISITTARSLINIGLLTEEGILAYVLTIPGWHALRAIKAEEGHLEVAKKLEALATTYVAKKVSAKKKVEEKKQPERVTRSEMKGLSDLQIETLKKFSVFYGHCFHTKLNKGTANSLINKGLIIKQHGVNHVLTQPGWYALKGIRAEEQHLKAIKGLEALKTISREELEVIKSIMYDIEQSKNTLTSLLESKGIKTWCTDTSKKAVKKKAVKKKAAKKKKVVKKSVK